MIDEMMNVIVDGVVEARSKRSVAIDVLSAIIDDEVINQNGDGHDAAWEVLRAIEGNRIPGCRWCP